VVAVVRYSTASAVIMLAHAPCCVCAFAHSYSTWTWTPSNPSRLPAADCVSLSLGVGVCAPSCHAVMHPINLDDPPLLDYFSAEGVWLLCAPSCPCTLLRPIDLGNQCCLTTPTEGVVYVRNLVDAHN
jgi:hypothetical protein